MMINEIIHKTLMAGLGVPEKLREVVDELVKKGELSESQGAKLIKECSEKVSRTGEELNQNISDIVHKILEKMNIPTQSDLEKLNRKVSALSSRVRKIEESSRRED